MADKRVIEQTASSEIYNDDWFLKDSVLNGTTKISAENLKELLTGDINDRADKLLRNIIGPTYEWSASKTYKAGAIVYYEDSLYYCIVDTATVGTFVPSEWRYTDLYENLTGKIHSVIKMLAPYMQFSDISSIMPYSKGDIVRYQPTGTYKEKFYVAKEDLPEGIESYDPNDWDEYDTIGELIAGIMAEAGKVDDVKVDGVSVVDENKVAQITTPDADGISYDNTTSGLEADDVQEAIDEVVGRVEDIEDKESTWDMVGSASGDIASFEDGSDNPMKSCVVEINPVQSGEGDPYPAGGGANKWDEEWELGRFNTATGENVSSTVQIRAKNKISVNPNTSYYAKGDGAYKGMWIIFFDSQNNVITNGLPTGDNASDNSRLFRDKAFTTPADCHSIRFYMEQDYGTTYNNNLSINYPSTVTTYSKYSNIRPISGFTEENVSVSGINVWDEEWEVGAYNTNDGTKVNATDRIRSKNFIPIIPNSQYFVRLWLGASYSLRLFYYDKSYNFINSPEWVSQGVITTPNNAYYMTFICASAYGTTYNNDISINYPSTDTSYHAYKGTTYNISWQTEAGTVYGGTLDVVSGVLMVDRVRASGLNWSEQSSETQKSYYSNVIDNIKLPTSPDVTVGAISSDYIEGGSSNFVQSGDGKFCISQSGRININDNRYQSLADFKVAIPNIDIVYELATPLTIQLSPAQVKSLLGSNNVWADTGAIEKVEYVRDATSIINNILERLEALEG